MGCRLTMSDAEDLSVSEDWCKTFSNTVYSSFKWTIHNFMSITDATIKSATFSAGSNQDTKWRIDLYPNNKDYVSIYLHLESCPNPQANAKYTITFLDEESLKTDYRWSSKKCFDANGRGWGWKGVIKRVDLAKHADSLLPQGNLTILCELAVEENLVNESGKSSQPEAKRFLQLSKYQGEMLTSAKFTDITLIFNDNQEIKAHKAVLASRSCVLEAMFDNEMKESKENIVKIEDVDYDVFEELLHFIYTSRTTDNFNQMATELFSAADKYDLAELQDLCEDSMCLNLNVSNVCGILKLAEEHSNNRLKTFAINFIKGHLNEVLKTDEFPLIVQIDLVKELLTAVAVKDEESDKIN